MLGCRPHGLSVINQFQAHGPIAIATSSILQLQVRGLISGLDDALERPPHDRD